MINQMEGQMSIFDLDGWFGKTSREHSAAMEEKTFKQFLPNSSEQLNPQPPMCLCLRKTNGPTQENCTMKWENGVLPIALTMPNFGERRNGDAVYLFSLMQGGYLPVKSCLTNILEKNPNPKYNLSAKACQGILNRAERRGKQLPEQLEKASRKQARGGLTYDVRISSDGTKNWRAHAYKTEISRALDTGGENPDSNHGGVCVVPKETVYSLNGKDVAPPLDAHYYLGAGARGGVEREAVLTYVISSYDSNAMKSPNPNSGIYEAETSRTLDNNGGNPSCQQGGMAVVHGFDAYNQTTTPVVYDARGNGDGQTVPTMTGDHMNRITDYTAVCIGNGQLDQLKENDKVGTLNCMHDQQAVITYSVGNGQVHDAMSPSKEISKTLNCLDDPAKIVTYGLDRATFNQGKNAQFGFSVDDTNGSLQSSACHNTNSNNICRTDSCVRRLTPLECTRLQSFPDGWVDIGEWKDSKGKLHKDADAPKYKALGNSIALPFWYFLLKKISATYDKGYTPTLGSLFDGIGGFPICWEQINGKGTARWASEIEEFCIALTKLRFPEE